MLLQQSLNKLFQQKAVHHAAKQAPAHHFSLQQLTLDQLAHYGLEVVGALVILVVGWTIANLASRWLKKWLSNKEKFDGTLVPIIADIIK